MLPSLKFSKWYGLRKNFSLRVEEKLWQCLLWFPMYIQEISKTRLGGESKGIKKEGRGFYTLVKLVNVDTCRLWYGVYVYKVKPSVIIIRNTQKKHF